ncbi:hypothetical protein GTO91_14435 [Heliobacterium undosum]|uniref:PIN domain-containing protein n=1 Tax=Heliomicrobium undosum TaxID=121734 RepID=A0A845L3Q3_9FIRM|nr:hypothetical protein [Heliomicrobium undosum]MZP30913.1 hypothetical protein [Heliomicrobium undosum]
MNKVLILDTSFLCCMLNVPGKNTCGKNNEWNHKTVNEYIEKAIQEKYTIVLPLATIIETGNHIAQASSFRYEKAMELGSLMRLAAEHHSPYAAFTDQSAFWNDQGLTELASHWPVRANEGLSIGDASITIIADYYAKTGIIVDIATGDTQLKAYEPARPANVPRRKR